VIDMVIENGTETETETENGRGRGRKRKNVTEWTESVTGTKSVTGTEIGIGTAETTGRTALTGHFRLPFRTMLWMTAISLIDRKLLAIGLKMVMMHSESGGELQTMRYLNFWPLWFNS
jgi:hypothetical protein